MSDARTISPDEPEDHGLSYTWLRDHGLRLLQALAGESWTDYNEHDPGVTILEHLCYALTGLSYRASLPITDLLSDRNGVVDLRRQSLLPPIDILPCNPLTVDDYRRLVLDRVPAVGNIWFTPHRSPPGTRTARGLYDVVLHAPDDDPCRCDDVRDTSSVRDRVLEVYTAHRNLCEDIHSINVLARVRTVVKAVVTVDESRPPEVLLAALLFNLGRFLAPEPRREPLAALLARGRTADEIFEGPLLHDGFIPDDELQPRVTRFKVGEIVRILARTSGALSVADVTVRAGNSSANGNDTITVANRDILALDTTTNDLGEFSISLRRRGAPCKVDPTRVRRELARMWVEQRRRHPLAPQYAQSFPPPKGAPRDLARYVSLQRLFPPVYGINDYGVSEEAGALRCAQARQLKGYLIVFEQMIANYFAQLSRARDLFSAEPALEQTYFRGSLLDAVPCAREVLFADHDARLERAMQGTDSAPDRRNRFLDLLLGLYADRVDSSMLAAVPGGEPPGERLCRVKIATLQQTAIGTRDRGRGFDYSADSGPQNLASMELRSRLELGLDSLEHRPLIETMDELGMELVSDEAAASTGRPLTSHAANVTTVLDRVTSLLAARARPDDIDPRAPSVLRSHAVTERFLHAAASLANFWVGTLPGERVTSLVCKAPEDRQLRLIGKYPDTAAAVAAAEALVKVTGPLLRRCRQLYLVEHTLLRFGRSLGDRPPTAGAAVPAPFEPSFTVTGIVSHSPAIERDPEDEATVQNILQRNAPAHIAVQVCFLTPLEMRRFEALHRPWQAALRQRNLRALLVASVALRGFLEEQVRP